MAFDKEKYRANRDAGKRGQGPSIKKYTRSVTGDGQQITFTNEGGMVVNNRAYRRRIVSSFPKSSQLRKKNKRKK